MHTLHPIIHKHISLKPYHTFGINVLAAGLAQFESLGQLQALLATAEAQQFKKLLVLGGGSNVLFTQPFDGLVLKNNIDGITVVAEDDEQVWVKAGAGVNWHALVMHAVNHGWGGIENLALIPGCVGAGPMQNIGAYGVELQSVFHQLEAYHLHDKTCVSFSLADCSFGYRDSVFKRALKGQFVILSVTLRLQKQPKFNVGYGAIRTQLEEMGVQELTLQAVSNAVIAIRQSKLPDPAVLGNAGSFFKNPTVDASVFASIQQQFSAVVGYPQANGMVKLAAGWLIEQCGLKGFRLGQAGVHGKQALVLVNHGNTTGTEVLALSKMVIAAVQSKFGVVLEAEVNVY
ncbi:MAG: UDP-N-acetylmuramate dehydrogenase [Bacteroidetes bacterium]|nr:MAG: UDP-N-acetylmuramate dehydrogenase [Bacteroidota bacterium]